MFKRVSELFNGESFVYAGWLYRATSQYRPETSQRYCEKLAFRVGNEWHTCNSSGEWFTKCREARIARLSVQEM